MKKFEFKISIEMNSNSKKSEAYNKLKHWLEHYAHTASSFGFEFEELDTIKDD